MIKFFRRIRQKLIGENQFTKYIIYAIGEIILVVIGILIALQINNWNNDRSERQLENQYLTEITSNLNSDLVNIERVLSFNKKKDSAIEMTFQLMSKPVTSQSSISLLPLLPILTEYEVFLSNRVAFDNMTSASSIGLISNDTLRQRLSTYYKNTLNLGDFTQEQIKQQTRRFVDESLIMVADERMAKTLTGYNIKLEQTNNFYTSPVNFKNLFNMRMNMVGQNNLMSSLKKQINSILEIVETKIQ